ncbi:cation:proton antiporter [Vibrio chagasii]|nr:cation:proton antiporter [Vibrio chagasii]
MFLVLGLLVTPSTLMGHCSACASMAFRRTFCVRCLFGWACYRLELYHQGRWFVSWVGLRGAVPIILAVFPMMAGLPNAQLYFNIAFFVVMVSLIVQGGSLMKVARLAQYLYHQRPTPVSRTGIEIYPTGGGEMLSTS